MESSRFVLAVVIRILESNMFHVLYGFVHIAYLDCTRCKPPPLRANRLSTFAIVSSFVAVLQKRKLEIAQKCGVVHLFALCWRQYRESWLCIPQNLPENVHPRTNYTFLLDQPNTMKSSTLTLGIDFGSLYLYRDEQNEKIQRDAQHRMWIRIRVVNIVTGH